MKSPNEKIGSVLSDRFVLIDIVGTGGSGVVYLARDMTLGRKVAIKLLHEGSSNYATFARQFHAEAKAAASLNHPSIVRVFDSGQSDSAPYLVFEFLSGGTLRALLDRDITLDHAQASAVAHDIAAALSYAHQKGYVHRDIKPSNLLFDEDGRIRVADFGIARALAAAAWTEPVGAVVGTARYASPEQIFGESSNKASDIYSFALVVTESVTGVPPFLADTTYASAMARTHGDFDVPEALGPLRPILRAMSRLDPSERISASEAEEAFGELSRLLPRPSKVAVSHYVASSSVLDPPTVVAPLTIDDDPNGLGFQPSQNQDAVAANEAVGGEPIDGTMQSAKALDLGLVGTDATINFEAAAIDATRTFEFVEVVAGSRVGRLPYDQDESFVPYDHEVDGAKEAVAGEEVPEAVVADDEAEEHSETKRGRIIGIALAILLLLAGGGAYALTLAQHSPTLYATPNVISLTVAQAKSSLTRSQLSLGRISYHSDPSIPSGSVISERPFPGSKLTQHSSVSLVVSTGPAPVSVPNVVGTSLEGANYSLVTAGLSSNVTTQYSETVPNGIVISQSPSSGTLKIGSVVSIIESKGPAPRSVPSLIGDSQSAANNALTSIGLVPSATTAYSNTVASGQVISQSVAPGNMVARGTTISFVVSLGPHLVTVPDLTATPLKQAEAALAAVGLSVGNVYGPNGNGVVIFQNPTGGTSVLYGTTVDVYTIGK
ncbi:MAG: PASTA domain-containing protein [Actinomycetota bacterium]|nr:PASTA domain-containing protein [Actinomycetota bacterium]